MISSGTSDIDAVLFTHEHADHTHGIDDLRAFFLMRRQRVEVWADDATGRMLTTRFAYCFYAAPGSDYPPILNLNALTAGTPVTIDGAGGAITATPFQVHHGTIDALVQVPTDDAGWDAVAVRAVSDAKAKGSFVPGLGHPVHKDGDPRTARLFELAAEHGVLGAHLQLFAAIGRVHPQVLGRTLPLNGAGVCGAVLADIEIPLGVVRGVALLARCAGLLGQLAEEMSDPIGMDIYMNVDRNTDYRPPVADH